VSVDQFIAALDATNDRAELIALLTPTRASVRPVDRRWRDP
jgi:hypothetical protein